MEILKHGKKNKQEDKKYAIFTCQCGCEFKATKEEYHEDCMHGVSSYPITHYLHANCPECYRMCVTTIKDEIENATVVYGESNTHDYIDASGSYYAVPTTMHKTESSRCCTVEVDENGFPKVDIPLT